MSVTIRPFQQSDASGVQALWKAVWPTAKAHNHPSVVIDLKQNVRDGLFWVAVDNGNSLDNGHTSEGNGSGNIIGTIMAGYDGHRGWLYRLAVAGGRRNSGVGRQLVDTAEAKLRELGCVKVNLQIRPNDKKSARFYMSLGYDTEARISMGKVL